MADSESTRTFYILFALLLVCLAAGGALLWQKMGDVPDRAPPPPAHTSTPLVGTARSPDVSGLNGVTRPPASDPARPTSAEPGSDPARPPRYSTDGSTRPSTGSGGRPGVTSMADLLRKLAAIKAEGSGVNTREELMLLGRQLAEEDFDNALRLMGAVSDFLTKSSLCRGIFETKGVLDPAAALAAAMKLDPGKRATGSGAKHLQNQRIYYEALIATMKGWSFSDPAAAAEYIGDLPADYQLVAAQSVFTSWAKSDPEAAIGAMDSLTPEAQVRILPEVVNGWAAADPGAAWNFVVALPESALEGKNLILANIASTWAQTDLAAAVGWIDRSLTDDRQYADVLERVTSKLAAESPETAAALITAIPGMYERQSALLTSTLRNWVGDDPVAAAGWVDSLTDATMRASAVKQTASFWSTQDPEAALAWADSIDDDLSRAYALSNVAVQQGARQPTESIDWIYQVDNDFARSRAVAGYIMGRMQRAGDRATTEALREMISSDTLDFDAVRALISRSSMTTEEKSVLLGLVQ